MKIGIEKGIVGKIFQFVNQSICWCQISGVKFSFPTWQIGQCQSFGRCSKVVPGGIPISGHPAAGSYMHPQISHLYFCVFIVFTADAIANKNILNNISRVEDGIRTHDQRNHNPLL